MITSGLYTALITPFDLTGAVDKEGLRKNIRFQKKEGIQGLVLLGSTGEASTLAKEEKIEVLKTAREEAKDHILLAGATSASTKEALETLCLLKDLDFHGALIAPPYYSKPTQEGIFRHFEALSQAKVPIIVYNHKGRTGVNIETETLRRIADLPSIIGVKEASGDLLQVADVIRKIKQDKNFLVFSGDDISTFSIMALGGDGVISVVSNAFPHLMHNLVAALLKGDFLSGRKMHYALLPLFKASNFETNPIPIKAIMQKCNLAAGNPRLPLTPLEKRYEKDLAEILKNLKKLNVA